ncbi:phage portal protein, putative, A118 family [Lacrimispora sphenoides]|uniref:phage portal protein n=1 Tax=Lacrimispora sphenoides TaxID=29370 RepID=UPI0008B069FF|nr:phage portal protein [Lacrimispora sphenoides]SET71257.1 phage portal protein, putative, A118 family [Lacrimispora sphenoides]
MLFQKEALEEFDVKPVTSQEMDIVIDKCMNIYQDRPYWLSAKHDIRTIGFGKVLCEETARLTTLAIHITIDGSPRAEWLQQQIEKRYFKIREWIEYGCAAGTFIVKPNGKGIDFLLPNTFKIVDSDDDGNITGIIFIDTYTTSTAFSRKYYTKFEYHRINSDTGEYLISNRAYVSTSDNDKGKPVLLEETKWAGLEPDVSLVKQNGEPLERMLFGVFRTPQANNTEINSPLGLPIYKNVLEELKGLDTAYSRNSWEIKYSRRMVLADDRLLMASGEKIKDRKVGETVEGLPPFIKNVFGEGPDAFYKEINPELNTDMRIKGINNELSFIGWKVGYSSGYFVFDQKTGMVTATQVESDDRRTIQLIKDCRDKLEDCMDGLIYALNVFADLYGLAPVGPYEVTYDFGDITYSREEDRARWWQYVIQGKVPAWLYYQKFEGMSEEEAKAMIAEAKADQKSPTLFGEE